MEYIFVQQNYEKKKYIYRIIKIIYLMHKAQFSLETLGREKIE